jgi:hypothetical protein
MIFTCAGRDAGRNDTNRTATLILMMRFSLDGGANSVWEFVEEE